MRRFPSSKFAVGLPARSQECDLSTYPFHFPENSRTHEEQRKQRKGTMTSRHFEKLNTLCLMAAREKAAEMRLWSFCLVVELTDKVEL